MAVINKEPENLKHGGTAIKVTLVVWEHGARAIVVWGCTGIQAFSLVKAHVLHELFTFEY